MIVNGPLRLRVVADKIIEQGGETLAVINENISATLLATFIDFLEDVSSFGATDEVSAELSGEYEHDAYYAALARLRPYAIAGAVPLALVEIVLSDALKQADTTLTPVITDEGTPKNDEPEAASVADAHKPEPLKIAGGTVAEWVDKITAEAAATDNEETSIHREDEPVSGVASGEFDVI